METDKIDAEYLVDTDWLIDFLAGRQAAVTLIGSLAPFGLALSIVSLGEAYEGVFFGRNPSAAEAALHKLVSEFEVVRLDDATMRIFGRIRGQLRQAGNLIQTADLLIAATALRYDLTLVTRNRRHFARVPELRLAP